MEPRWHFTMCHFYVEGTADQAVVRWPDPQQVASAPVLVTVEKGCVLLPVLLQQSPTNGRGLGAGGN